MSGFTGYAQNKPNIVIILADDMGYGDVFCNNPYARTRTPAIDKMAEEGIRFTKAHSGGAVSIPSRYGLMTGRYNFREPQRDGYWGYLPPLIENGRETLGTLMRRAGYITACIGKWHLGLNWQKRNNDQPLIPVPQVLGYTNVDYSKEITGGPVDLGFDYSFIIPGSLDMPPYLFIRGRNVVDQQMILTADIYPTVLPQTEFAWDRRNTKESDVYWERGVWWRNGEMSKSFKMENCLDMIVEEGLSFIDNAASQNKPFMLYLPITGPHTPWVTNSEFKGSSDFGNYGDFIFQIDDVVDQINEKLKELNIDKNTMVIFSSDNGSPWGEEDILYYAHNSNYGRRGQKGDIWDGGHHVPLFITWPEYIKKPAVYSHDISLIDLLATFSDLTREPIIEGFGEDSFSFMSVLNGDMEKPTRNHIIYMSSQNKLAIKVGDYKYIDCIGSGGHITKGLSSVKNGVTGQLYNVSIDSLELNNLILLEKEKAKEVSDLLKEYVFKNSSFIY